MTIVTAHRRASAAAPTLVAAPVATAAPPRPATAAALSSDRSFFGIESSDYHARWTPFQASQAVQLVRIEAARHTHCEPLRVCFHANEGFSCVCGATRVSTPHQLPQLHALSSQLSIRAVVDLIRVRLSLPYSVVEVVDFMCGETSDTMLPHAAWTYRYNEPGKYLEATHPEWGYILLKGSVIRCEKPSALDVFLTALDKHQQRKRAAQSLDLLLLAAKSCI